MGLGFERFHEEYTIKSVPQMEMTAEMSKGQRGGGKFLYIYYLNSQDCAGGLGHKVLMRGHLQER